jgi:hypothetical protein
MAVKISELDPITGADLADGDLFVVVDVSEADATATKRITKAELQSAVGAEVSTDPDFSVDPTSLADRETIAGRDLQGGTVVATTSGTGFDFTGIPAGVQEINVIFDDVSLSGTNSVLVQLGDAGGFETTGYDGGSALLGDAGAFSSNSPNGFMVRLTSAGRRATGTFTIKRLEPGSNRWVANFSGVTLDGSNYRGLIGGGAKTLSAELDRVRIARDGSDTFDSGQLNVRWR